MTEAVVDGLAIYAKIKAITTLIIAICIYSCCTYCTGSIYNKKYTAAQNSQITYKTNAQGDNCIVGSSNDPGCNYYAEYNDVNNNHYVIPINPPYNNNKPPTVGSTPIYYDGITPSNYITSSLNPLYFSLGALFLCFFLIIGMIVNVYFIFKYKNYAAFNGGIDAAGSLMNSSNSIPVSIPNPGFNLKTPWN